MTKKHITLLLCCACACAHPTVATAMAPSSPALPAAPLSQPPSVVLPQWDVPELLHGINDQRRSDGAAPLLIDRSLCVVAERASAEYQRLGRGAEDRVAGLMTLDLQGFGLTFSDTGAAVGVIEDMGEAPRLLAPALDPTMTYVGLFVAPAPAPSGPRGGFAVAVALGK